MTFRLPVNGTLVENFGFYGDVGTAAFHYGIDFSAIAGTDVFSMVNGRVVFSSSAAQNSGNGYGYTIIIQHNDDAGSLIDRFSVYSHLQAAPLLAAGSNVTAGRHIGDVGSTGGSYGNHLHLSVLGGLQAAGLLRPDGTLPPSTNIYETVRNYALQIGTFGSDSGTPTHEPGSPPYYGNIINPGTIYGDLRGPSNDWILPIAGNDIVDGRTGIDTVEYQESIDRIWFYRVDSTTTISIVTSATGATQGDILYNVERLADSGGRNLIDLASADLQTLFVGSSSASTRYVVPTQEYRNVEIDGGGGQDTVVIWGVRSDWQVVNVAGSGYWLTSNSTPSISGLRTAAATSSASGPYTIKITDVEQVEFSDGSFAVTSLLGGVSGPDLTVGAVGLNTSGASPGSDVTVSFDVVNIGNQATESTRGEIVISSSSDFSGSVRILDTFNIGALDANGGLNSSRSYIETLTLPVTLGRTNYYVGVRVDTTNSITEANEGNNFGVSSALAVGGGLSGDVDLRVNVTSFPDGFMTSPGGAVTLNFRISANSNGSVPYTYRVYYSADETLGANDVLLHEATTARGLGYQGVHYYDLGLSLPNSADIGIGYFFVQVDPDNVIAEQQEDNNLRSRPVLISPDSPDEDTLPDLFAQRVHLRDADTHAPISTLYAGELFNYAVDFGNYSPDDGIPEVRNPDLAPSFHNALVISEDAIITQSDRVLGTSFYFGFAPGEYRTTSSSITTTLPNDIASGTYFIAVVADYYNTVAEENESNNVSLVRQVEIINNIPVSVTAVNDTLLLENAASIDGNVLSNDVFQLFSTPTIDRINSSASLLGTAITLSSGAVFQLNADGTYALEAGNVLAGMSVGSQVTETISYRAVGVNRDVSTAEVEITISRADPDTGGIGNDQVNGTQWNDILHGREGNDSVFGFDGNDTIYGGGNGTNQLFGHDGNDLVYAGAGGDFIGGGAGNDTIRGGDGADTIYGGFGNDNVGGGAGNDLIFGAAGANIIWGGLGSDTVQGATGSDTIYGGGNGTNQLFGHDGNDFIQAGAGGDFIGGGAGNDTIRGGTGSDTIYGGLADDNIGGGAGNDVIFGSVGNNTIWGGLGDDTIHAGTGRDVINGGTGADTFVFASATHIGIGARRDVITDFQSGVDDIDLRALNTSFNGSSGLLGGGQASFYYFAASGLLIGDQNGNGVADWVLELVGAPAIAAGDFLI